MPITRKQTIYFILSGFFLTNAILGELTGGKLFRLPGFNLGGFEIDFVLLSIGVIPWPVVFVTTDLVNEYFGKAGVRRLTYLAVGMIVYAFIILYFAIRVPAWENSPVSNEAFKTVFGQSMWIIAGSIVAFVTSQLLDVVIFQAFKRKTGGRLLWLRATGSTAMSQLVDTFVILFIAFRLPTMLQVPNYKFGWADLLRVSIGNYSYKLLIAVLITPIIYLAHGIIDAYLARDNESRPVSPPSM